MEVQYLLGCVVTVNPTLVELLGKDKRFIVVDLLLGLVVKWVMDEVVVKVDHNFFVIIFFSVIFLSINLYIWIKFFETLKILLLVLEFGLKDLILEFFLL